jgi:hypothetical protein
MSARCEQPIDPADLLDYWLADGERPDDDAIEEHLLGCDACSGRLRGLAALGEGVRQLARRGAAEAVVTPSFLEQAAREGLRMREYRVRAGERVDCTVTRQDDLVVSRLQGDFRGIMRLDLLELVDGWPEQRILDVPVPRDAGELIIAQSMPLVRALGRTRTRVRLLAQEAGGERLVGEYTFDHTPTVD